MCSKGSNFVNMDNMQENYDPNQNVCTNQDDFNHAVRKALKYNMKEDVKKAKPYMMTYVIIWLVMLIWALMLAMQVPVSDGRTIHLVLAITVSPVYILSYYLGMMQTKGGMGMGCGGNMVSGGMRMGRY